MGDIFLCENNTLQYYIGNQKITTINLGDTSLYESVQWGKVIFQWSQDATQLKRIQIINGNFMLTQKPHELFTSGILESFYSVWGPNQSGTTQINEGDSLIICIKQIWIQNLRQRFNALYYILLSDWETGNYGNDQKTAIYVGSTVADTSGKPDLTNFTYLTPYVEMVYDI